MIEVWLNKNCVRHPRISGGVVVLLRNFNRSQLAQHGRTYSLGEFKKFLEENGLQVIKEAGTLLVPGLALAEDLQAFKGSDFFKEKPQQQRGLTGKELIK